MRPRKSQSPTRTKSRGLRGWLRRNPCAAAIVLLSPGLIAIARVGALATLAPAVPAQPAEQVEAPAAGELGAPNPAAVLEAQTPVGKRAVDRYSRGDFEQALATARGEGLLALASSLEELQLVYYSARDARAQRRVGEAIERLQAALEIDGRLAPSGSELGEEIRRQLSKLHTAKGKELLSLRNASGARRALAEAIRLDDSNSQAARLLRRLEGRGQSGRRVRG